MTDMEKRRLVRVAEGGLTIRTYEPKDSDQVWTLHTEGLLTPSADSHWDEDMRDIEVVYLGEGSHFWVVEEGERLIGMVAVRRQDEGTAELKRMRVAGDRRRRGLGQRLLEVAEEFCRHEGYRRVILDTPDRQEAARHLYEKNGYDLYGAMPLSGFALLFYSKELA